MHSHTTELLPCPFCHYVPGAPLLFAKINASESLVCGHCGAYGPAADTEAEAIAAWNRRSYATALCQQGERDAKDAARLRQIAGDGALMEIGRRAVENMLIEWRDARLSEPMRGNGLVIREANGEASNIIRFGTEIAVQIALSAIAAHLDAALSTSEGKTE